MSRLSKRARRRVFVFAAFYLVAYFIASYMDLATTSLGLQRPGVTEKNVLATNAEGYVAAKAWLLTIGGAIVMSACILFSARNAVSVESIWLRHPMRSFGTFYLNPWSPRGIGISPLHMLSFVIAFVLLRVLAAANNLLVYWYGFGPMGELIKWVATKTSPLAGFCIVGFSFFLLTVVAVTPLAARLIASWRSQT